MSLQLSLRLPATLFLLALGAVPACDDDNEPSTVVAPLSDAGAPADASAGIPSAPVEVKPIDAASRTDQGTSISVDAGAPPPRDLDIAVVRLNADGTLDTSFGTGGIARIDFGPGAGTVRDSLWGLSRDDKNRILLFGAKKGEGARTDTDRVAVRLLPTGALDTSFATMGTHTLNIANLGENARHGLVQADGKIVTSGYVNYPTGVGTQASNRIQLVRLDDTGKGDPTFGAQGVVTSMPPAFIPADPVRTEWGMVEAYAVGEQAGKYVTTGYGRRAATGLVDMVSFRFLGNGDPDPSWGTKGVVELDLIGDNDRGRHLLVLPDMRVLVLGSATPKAMNIDALAMMLKADGQPDTSFGTDGYRLFDFERPDEAFYGAALSPSGKWAMATGYRAGMVGGVAQDDDALVAMIPTGMGTLSAKAVPLSETLNDRFWGAAFDASDRGYAAGFITDGGDSRMVVARFDVGGTLDTTFGAGGIVQVNVAVGPGVDEAARGVVVQSDGKIVIAGPFEKP